MDPVSKAQHESHSPKYRTTSFRPGNPTRFVAGISGNPSGRPVDPPFTKMCKKLMRSKAGRELVEHVVNDVLGKRGMAAVLLLREIAERTDGKVTQGLELSGEINLTLAERLTKAKEHLQLVSNSDTA